MVLYWILPIIVRTFLYEFKILNQFCKFESSDIFSELSILMNILHLTENFYIIMLNFLLMRICDCVTNQNDLIGSFAF